MDVSARLLLAPLPSYRVMYPFTLQAEAGYVDDVARSVPRVLLGNVVDEALVTFGSFDHVLAANALIKRAIVFIYVI